MSRLRSISAVSNPLGAYVGEMTRGLFGQVPGSLFRSNSDPYSHMGSSHSNLASPSAYNPITQSSMPVSGTASTSISSRTTGNVTRSRQSSPVLRSSGSSSLSSTGAYSTEPGTEARSLGQLNGQVDHVSGQLENMARDNFQHSQTLNRNLSNVSDSITNMGAQLQNSLNNVSNAIKSLELTNRAGSADMVNNFNASIERVASSIQGNGSSSHNPRHPVVGKGGNLITVLNSGFISMQSVLNRLVQINEEQLAMAKLKHGMNPQNKLQPAEFKRKAKLLDPNDNHSSKVQFLTEIKNLLTDIARNQGGGGSGGPSYIPTQATKGLRDDPKGGFFRDFANAMKNKFRDFFKYQTAEHMRGQKLDKAISAMRGGATFDEIDALLGKEKEFWSTTFWDRIFKRKSSNALASRLSDHFGSKEEVTGFDRESKIALTVTIPAYLEQMVKAMTGKTLKGSYAHFGKLVSEEDYQRGQDAEFHHQMKQYEDEARGVKRSLFGFGWKNKDQINDIRRRQEALKYKYDTSKIFGKYGSDASNSIFNDFIGNNKLRTNQDLYNFYNNEWGGLSNSGFNNIPNWFKRKGKRLRELFSSTNSGRATLSFIAGGEEANLSAIMDRKDLSPEEKDMFVRMLSGTNTPGSTTLADINLSSSSIIETPFTRYMDDKVIPLLASIAMNTGGISPLATGNTKSNPVNFFKNLLSRNAAADSNNIQQQNNQLLNQIANNTNATNQTLTKYTRWEKFKDMMGVLGKAIATPIGLLGGVVSKFLGGAFSAVTQKIIGTIGGLAAVMAPMFGFLKPLTSFMTGVGSMLGLGKLASWIGGLGKGALSTAFKHKGKLGLLAGAGYIAKEMFTDHSAEETAEYKKMMADLQPYGYDGKGPLMVDQSQLTQSFQSTNGTSQLNPEMNNMELAGKAIETGTLLLTRTSPIAPAASLAFDAFGAASAHRDKIRADANGDVLGSLKSEYTRNIKAIEATATAGGAAIGAGVGFVGAGVGAVPGAAIGGLIGKITSAISTSVDRSTKGGSFFRGMFGLDLTDEELLNRKGDQMPPEVRQMLADKIEKQKKLNADTIMALRKVLPFYLSTLAWVTPNALVNILKGDVGNAFLTLFGATDGQVADIMTLMWYAGEDNEDCNRIFARWIAESQKIDAEFNSKYQSFMQKDVEKRSQGAHQVAVAVERNWWNPFKWFGDQYTTEYKTINGPENVDDRKKRVNDLLAKGQTLDQSDSLFALENKMVQTNADGTVAPVKKETSASFAKLSAVDAAVKLIIRAEGFSKYPYADRSKDKSKKESTAIGHGINLTYNPEYSKYINPGGDIDEKTSISIVTEITTKNHARLSKSYKKYNNLNKERQAALLDMAYNLGYGGLTQAFKKSFNHILNGNYLQAGANLRKTDWFKQVKGRAERDIAIIEQGVITEDILNLQGQANTGNRLSSENEDAGWFLRALAWMAGKFGDGLDAFGAGTDQDTLDRLGFSGTGDQFRQNVLDFGKINEQVNAYKSLSDADKKAVNEALTQLAPLGISLSNKGKVNPLTAKQLSGLQAKSSYTLENLLKLDFANPDDKSQVKHILNIVKSKEKDRYIPTNPYSDRLANALDPSRQWLNSVGHYFGAENAGDSVIQASTKAFDAGYDLMNGSTQGIKALSHQTLDNIEKWANNAYNWVNDAATLNSIKKLEDSGVAKIIFDQKSKNVKFKIIDPSKMTSALKFDYVRLLKTGAIPLDNRTSRMSAAIQSKFDINKDTGTWLVDGANFIKNGFNKASDVVNNTSLQDVKSALDTGLQVGAEAFEGITNQAGSLWRSFDNPDSSKLNILIEENKETNRLLHQIFGATKDQTGVIQETGNRPNVINNNINQNPSPVQQDNTSRFLFKAKESTWH